MNYREKYYGIKDDDEKVALLRYLDAKEWDFDKEQVSSLQDLVSVNEQAIQTRS